MNTLKRVSRFIGHCVDAALVALVMRQRSHVVARENEAYEKKVRSRVF